MGRIIVGLLLLLVLAGCQEDNTPNNTASPTRPQQTAYEKYLADCKAKNGERHWGPFSAYSDMRNPKVWYKNGRYETVKFEIDSITNKVWVAAEKQRACVVAPPSKGYFVTLSLDNGAEFKIRRRHERDAKTVKEVSISIQ